MHPLPVLPAGRLEQQFADKKPRYTAAEAVTEANRCIYCVDAPCIKACPTTIDIPTFIHKIATENTKGAARTILAENILGASCARVCPVEELCAGACVYNAWGREPIAIGRLQRFATEATLEKAPLSALLPAKKPTTGKKVALVGSGPASIAAAGLLALEGVQSVIFEKRAIAGGLNTLGIAPYKQSGQASLDEINQVLALGNIELKSGIEVVGGAAGAGQISSDTLLKDFDAVFLGLGLGSDSKLNVPGESGSGVYGAVELIERIKAEPGLKLSGTCAFVIGGGNTALDIAHELKLLGFADVALVYRRGEKDMSGYAHELAHAREDGARLLEHRVVTEVLRNASGALTGVKLAQAKDGKAVAGTEETVSVDLIAVAIGQSVATGVAKAFSGVQLDAKGRVVVDAKTHRTGNPKVWSGGDCVNGGKEVVNGVQEAKLAVKDMLRALGGK
ncbi:MAG: FAD-dependent oxidoreductase [Myxococcales bacterium]|nr:FAD-dependent oxidoreductase [Myxococcales bacterium]